MEAATAEVTELEYTERVLDKILVRLTQLWVIAGRLVPSWVETRQEPRMDPDYAPEDDLDRVIRLASRAAAQSVIEIQNYSEHGGGNGSKSWQRWMLTLAGVLVASGVVGAVLMYGKLSSLEAQVQAVQNQVNDVKRLVEPRYRGEQ
jgi:hypothetical protein